MNAPDLTNEPPADDSPTPHPDISRQSPLRLLGRALLLRCPNCGARHIFTGFFDLKKRCPNCGMLLERGESDYFLGAYTVNLIAVEVLLALGFLIVMVATWPKPPLSAGARSMCVSTSSFLPPGTLTSESNTLRPGITGGLSVFVPAAISL